MAEAKQQRRQARVEGACGAEEEEEAEAIAEIVGCSAVRYFELSHRLSKDYALSIPRMLAFKGNTGPYLMWAPFLSPYSSPMVYPLRLPMVSYVTPKYVSHPAGAAGMRWYVFDPFAAAQTPRGCATVAAWGRIYCMRASFPSRSGAFLSYYCRFLCAAGLVAFCLTLLALTQVSFLLALAPLCCCCLLAGRRHRHLPGAADTPPAVRAPAQVRPFTCLTVAPAHLLCCFLRTGWLGRCTPTMTSSEFWRVPSLLRSPPPPTSTSVE